jgi:hypothetical protein
MSVPVETLSQEHHEKFTRTLTEGSEKEISEKKADDEPTPALPFTNNSDVPAQPPAFRRTRRYWIVVAAFYYFFFILGLNGGSTGPLLPRYQQFYQVWQFSPLHVLSGLKRLSQQIDYLTTSMIFVSNACVRPIVASSTRRTSNPIFPGITDGRSNHALFRKATPIFNGPSTQKSRLPNSPPFFQIVISASLLPLAGYSIMASAPPFGVMCTCFFINGINFSLINTQATSVLALLPSKTLLGLGHSLFGAGALVAPLISTQFAQIPRWSFHYLVLLGVAIGDFVQMVGVFRGRGFEDVSREMGIAPEVLEHPVSPISSDSCTMGDGTDREEVEEAVGILPKKLYVPLLALFMFLCVGVEVSIGGADISLSHSRKC